MSHLARISLCASLLAALAHPLHAQNDNTPDAPKPEKKKGASVSIGGNNVKPAGQFYWSSGMEGSLFQTSRLDRPGLSSTKFTTLRYSYVFNIALNLNYDFTNNVGLFLPLSIKNIGFIDKMGDSTIKRRSYNLGAALGLKVGNMQKHSFGFVGGGVDLPFNYREKGFVKRTDKDKFSEWFSDRTPTFMPFVFAGFSIDPGITLKAQYYPGNFLNPDFVQSPSLVYQPYKGYNVNLMYLSVGFNINYKKQPKEDYSDMEQPATKQL